MKHSDEESTTPIPVPSNSSPSNNDDIVNSPFGIPTTLSSSQTAGSPPFKTPPTTSTHSNIQRPRMVPFNTVHNDKYSHSLREFPLHHFDRNLTVEKATFDTALPSYIPSQQQQQTPLNVPLGTSTTSTSTIATTSTVVTNRHDNNSLIDTSNPVVGTPPARSSTAPILHSPLPLIQTQQLQDDTPLSASSSSSKILDKSATAYTKRQESISQSPPRTPLSNKMKSSAMKNEGERRSTKKKKRKLPPVNGTATPSEVFHRNLVDAVSNVEDSDENEQYVYPYSHHDQSSTTSNKNHHRRKRNHFPTNFRRSTAPSPSSPGGASTLSIYHQQQQQQHQQYEQELQQKQQQANYGTSGIDTLRHPPSKPNGGGTRGFLNDLLLNNYQHRSMPSFFKTTADDPMKVSNTTYPPSSNQQQQQLTSPYYAHGMNTRLSPGDEENGTWINRGYHRPKLRNHVMDHPRSSSSFPQPWAHEFSSSEDYDDDEDDHQQQQRSYRRYHHDRYGEQLYLLRHPEPQKQPYCGGFSWGRIFRNTCISVFIFMLMLLILILYLF